MLRKKRSFKINLPAGELNIISLMDVLTTLLFFLLIAAAASNFSIISGYGVPANLPSGKEDNTPKFMMEIMVQPANETTIWIAPIAGLRVSNPQVFVAYLQANFSGNLETGFMRKVKGADMKSLALALQDALVPVKKAFPRETTAILAFTNQVPYQDVLDLLSAVGSIPDQAPAFEVVDFFGQKSLSRVLFPQTIISETGEEPGRAPAGG